MRKLKTNSKLKCPKCNKIIYGWRKASKHSKENKHYGDYNIYENISSKTVEVNK